VSVKLGPNSISPGNESPNPQSLNPVLRQAETIGGIKSNTHATHANSGKFDHPGGSTEVLLENSPLGSKGGLIPATPRKPEEI
jgi:hypothetical protein